MESRKEYPKISITGDLGSGKSAVSKIISPKIGFEYFSTGKIQRAIAEKYNMTTLELNKYSETHPEIDKEVDSGFINLKEEKKSLVVDSRMAWFFIPTSFRVYLSVDINIAAKRIMADESRGSEKYLDLNEAKEKIQHRKASENKRYLELYGADAADIDNFDLYIDTSYANLDEVTDLIITNFNLWKEGKEFQRKWIAPKSLYPSKILTDERETKEVLESIKANGYDLNNKIVAIKEGNKYVIVDGHKRTSGAIANNMKFIPAEIITRKKNLHSEIDVTVFLESLKREIFTKWEEVHKFNFFDYPVF